MIYLLIAILFNIGIFLSFRAYGKFKINTLQAITWNYLVGAILGMSFQGILVIPNMELMTKPWFPLAGILAFLFVMALIVIDETTQRFNVTVTSVANKIALIIPVISSILILQTEQNSFGALQWIGLVLAITAIVLTSIRKKDSGIKIKKSWEIIFPILVFLMGGTIDSLVNYTNFYFLTEQDSNLFSISLFTLSFLTSAIIVLIKKPKFDKKAILGGVFLGACNYFSLHFVLKGLTAMNNNGALFYPIFNIGVILGATLFAYLIFRDKLLKINLVGLAIAVLALILLALRAVEY
ncbi:hypothetical protein [Peijinzhouia sedimentorum]